MSENFKVFEGMASGGNMIRRIRFRVGQLTKVLYSKPHLMNACSDENLLLVR